LFEDILQKDKLDKQDLSLMIERITIFEDSIDIQLKSDIDDLLSGTVPKSGGQSPSDRIIQSAKNQRDKVYAINVVSEGDPLEIFTDREGEIILKKYSPIGELGNFAKEYVESLATSSGHITCIVDKDQIIAVSGGAKKELFEKHISPQLEKAINGRSAHSAGRGEPNFIPILEDDPQEIYNNQMITPIMAEGDVLGAILFLSPDKKMGELESKLAATAAGFIGKQMEQ